MRTGVVKTLDRWRVKLCRVSDLGLVRVFRWLRDGAARRRGVGAALAPDAAGLVVVAACYDDVESCSAALERAAAVEPRWSAQQQALVRHPLVVPATAVEEIRAIVAQEGYGLVAGEPALPDALVGELATDAVLLFVARSELLDALHCSQERSRMAGLAQRHGGRALGWDALQPDPVVGPTR